MSPTLTRGFAGSVLSAASIWSQHSTAHMPSFSLTWSLPVPKLSSPHTKGEYLPLSIRFPKNFHPVGVSNNGIPLLLHTRSSAPLVGMLRAAPPTPFVNWGMRPRAAWSTMTARESLGVTKKPCPSIMFLSPSPSAAAPKKGAPSAPSSASPVGPTLIFPHSSAAFLRLGSACPCEGDAAPPKSGRGWQFWSDEGGHPSRSTRTALA
mmetsp:Transcript_37102/g.90078  ORF Transcript_37102/g.90078 Transcript_37102/m.90078 type:complete len:207 (+) Transcript_37102:573-1193(+)